MPNAPNRIRSHRISRRRHRPGKMALQPLQSRLSAPPAKITKKAASSTIATPANLLPPIVTGAFSFAPDPLWVRIVKFYCPGCGTQVETEYLPPRPSLSLATSKSISINSKPACKMANSPSAPSASSSPNEFDRHRRRRHLHRSSPALRRQSPDEKGAHHTLRSLRLFLARLKKAPAP